MYSEGPDEMQHNSVLNHQGQQCSKSSSEKMQYFFRIRTIIMLMDYPKILVSNHKDEYNNSDFIWDFGKISQRFLENNPQNTQNWENTGHFLIGNSASIRR